MEKSIYKGQNEEYVLEDSRPIAYGRISVLLLAKDSTDKVVVIKEFRNEPQKTDDFQREIAAQKSLIHNNIVPVIDYGISQSSREAPFLVMPHCKWGSLADTLDSRDFLPLEKTLAILDQLAQAVDYAHRQGFIHGDIKPENILFLNDENHACLTDFGSAKFFPVDTPITLADSDPTPGTLAYLSPEQVSDGKQFPASDIYALAIVAYKMLTGKLPYKSNLPPYQFMYAKVTGDILDPLQFNHHLSNHVKDALFAGMNIDPKSRPSSASDFVELLRNKNKEFKVEKKSNPRFWSSLEPAHKVAIITGIITAIVAIITTIINIIPALLGP